MNEAEFNQFSKRDRFNRVLEGKAYWAFIANPKVSDRFKTTTYVVNLGLDEANQELAKSYGLKVKPADLSVPMPYVTINRKVKPGINPEEVKPVLIDTSSKAITDTLLIGNESTIRVKFGTYWFPNNGGGVGTILQKVQVINLIPYESKDKDFISDGSGYTYTEETTKTSTTTEGDDFGLEYLEDDSEAIA